MARTTVITRIKGAVPRPIRGPLGQIVRACEAPFYYLRAKKILRDYTDHYQQAQRAYRQKSYVPRPVVESLAELGVRVVSPGSPDNLIGLPENYLGLVERVGQAVHELFSDSRRCSFFPCLPDPIAEQTEDVAAIKDGAVIAIQLKNPLDVDGLADLCKPIMHEIEEKIYGSYGLVDKVYVYRSAVSRQQPQGSWLWHYDNHPHEIIKVMIYLTDVNEQSAPFEYMRHADSMKAVAGPRLTPLYGESRLTREELQRCHDQGFVTQRITGPRGTTIVFDNNMIHRANRAAQSHRDVLILQVRPVLSKHQPYVDPRWTGSFQHAPFTRNPNNTKTTTRRLRHFS